MVTLGWSVCPSVSVVRHRLARLLVWKRLFYHQIEGVCPRDKYPGGTYQEGGGGVRSVQA